MKKLLVILMAAVLGLTLAACDDGKSDNVSGSDVIVGGWTKTESPELTAEVKTLLEKAASDMDGAEYTPVAYLGTQVVAGTNHLILCKITPVVPDATSTYALVTVYEDLEGNASITDVLSSKAEAGVGEEPGAWTDTETLAVTEDASKAFVKATKNITGATYSLEALLGTQVVAGTNYRMLCEVTPVIPNAQTKYAIVIVYQGADGAASITETIGFGEDAAE